MWIFSSGVQDLDSGLAAIDELIDENQFITVNFNTSDKDLTQILINITNNRFLDQASMYNFTGSSTTLSKDLEWAILQG